MSSNVTHLDDDVTFTRGTGAISFGGYLYSNTNERNDLTFNGTGGGDVSVTWGIGGGGATPTTKLGDILFSSVADITIGETISAGSLISLNGTGRINLGQNSSYSHFYDYAGGLQISTTGAHDHYGGDENIYIYGDVTNSHNSAPISVTATNGNISTYNYTDLTTAGGAVSLNAATSISLNHDTNISTSGGNVTLKAGSGVLTLGAYTDITTSNGLLSLTGTGVSQSASESVLNAGTGKIRIDGGGGAVSLYGRLITTNADTNGTPSILVTNVVGGANFRSVESQTGTFQVGLIAGNDVLAATQTRTGAGNLALTTPEIRLRTAQAVKITSAGDDSGLTFTVTGTAADGSPLVEFISGANAGSVTTSGAFKTITSIATDGSAAGNVSVGLAADDAVSGSLTQSVNNSYSDNQIDIETLSAATTSAISITSVVLRFSSNQAVDWHG